MCTVSSGGNSCRTTSFGMPVNPNSVNTSLGAPLELLGMAVTSLKELIVVLCGLLLFVLLANCIHKKKFFREKHLSNFFSPEGSHLFSRNFKNNVFVSELTPNIKTILQTNPMAAPLSCAMSSSIISFGVNTHHSKCKGVRNHPTTCIVAVSTENTSYTTLLLNLCTLLFNGC